MIKHLRIMKKLFVFILCVTVSTQIGFAMDAYPKNWFVQMKWNRVQILFKDTGFNFSHASVAVSNKKVGLLKTYHFSNPHYLAVDITIPSNTTSGDVVFSFKNDKASKSMHWSILSRRDGKGKEYAQGVNASDFIYFLMPDRFSNGDVSNDRIAGLKDQSLNRDSIYHRHGGDLKGVLNHLDYLEKLGATTLWMTPVIENDMPNRTEHGYSFTDHYAIEKRFGGEAAYKALSDALHQKGMKLIQDVVYNHVGRFHFLVQDPPEKDWLHQWPTYTQTNYKDQSYFDPYKSKTDFKKLVDGWFTTEMPDVNHQNPFVANFLIQHALWTIETFGVDGFRVDTYIYNDLSLMNRLNTAVLDEYPKFTTFGENWVHGVSNQAYFVENKMDVPFKSNLQGAVDFQLLFYGILPSLNEKFGWTEGVNKLYNTLSSDFLYKDPYRNVIFLDNHDMTRILSSLNGDVQKLKTAFMWLMTCRGIPQMYYGTEVLMKGVSNPDGWVRLDFPGGWEGDAKSAFTGKGLTEEESTMQSFVAKLANYRKNCPALQTGKLMQYLPKEGLYVYFRYDQNKTIMCIMNTDDKERKIDFDQYEERTNGFKTGKDIISEQIITDHFSIPAQSMQILELKK